MIVSLLRHNLLVSSLAMVRVTIEIMTISNVTSRFHLKWSSKLRSFEMESEFSPLEGYQLHIGLTKRETRFAESKLERA